MFKVSSWSFECTTKFLIFILIVGKHLYLHIYKFHIKYKGENSILNCFVRDSLTLLCTPVSAIFDLAPKLENMADIMLHCIFG